MPALSLRFIQKALIQSIKLDKPVKELQDYDQRLMAILYRHLAVLTCWCTINLLSGLIGLVIGQGSWFYFFMMNGSWAIMNSLVVLWIYRHISEQRFRLEPASKRLKVQRHVETMLVINIVLDLLYIVFSWLMFSWSKAETGMLHILWLGFSWSVMVQGAYLLLQDLYFYRLHRLNIKQTRPFLVAIPTGK